MKNSKFLIGMLFLMCFIFYSIPEANAQKGLFVKYSQGPGYTIENSKINSSGFSVVTINHAIGWGITDNFAVQVGKFAGLNKMEFGENDYINLDVFGLGFRYRTPIDLKISVLGGYSKVSYAEKWYDPSTGDGGNGVGANISIDKEWFIAKRWGLSVGPQLFWLNTKEIDHKFFNVSLNGSVVYYLKPVRQTKTSI